MIKIEKKLLANFKKAAVALVAPGPRAHITKIFFVIPGVPGEIEAWVGSFLSFAHHQDGKESKRLRLKDGVRYDNLSQWLKETAAREI